MTAAATGVVVEIEERKFLLPFERVAFVVPLRGTEGATLTMPRGRLPLVDPRPRLGLASAGRPRNAVAVKGRFGFYALAVDGVELVGAESAGKEKDFDSLDPSSLLSEEEERALFAEPGP
jgi:hypothetical protein